MQNHRFVPQALRTLGLLGVGVLLLTTGCQSIPWKLYRTISPYSKTQEANPYANTLRALGGAEFSIRRFYATKELACVVLHVTSKEAYAEIYIHPGKARLVSGKVGVPAMQSTTAAREPMFQRMVADYHKIKDPNQVSRWSKYYFPRGTIPGGKPKTGFVCFQLATSPKDPDALKLGNKCRMQLLGVMIAKGPAQLDWLYFAPMTPEAIK